MRTKITLLSVVTLWFATVVPLNAQGIEKTGFFKGNPVLGGDVTINNLTHEVIGEDSYTHISIVAGYAGNYYLNFWLLPAKYTNGSLSVFEVRVNGKKAGYIVPEEENWQCIGLYGEETVELAEGENLISVVTQVPHVPEIEFLRMASDKNEALISPEAYNNYLTKAETGNNTALPIVDDPKEPEEEWSSVLEQSDGGISFPNLYFELKANRPAQYSFRKTTYFRQGEEVIISSESEEQHVVELFFAHDTGTFSGAYASQPRQDTAIQATNIRLTAPETGYYYVKARTANNNTGHVADININGLRYENMPIYYAVWQVEYPAVGETFATITLAFDETCNQLFDPTAYIEADNIIVGYNDDGNFDNMDGLGVHEANSYHTKCFTQPATGIHLTSGSYYPQAKCPVMRVLDDAVAEVMAHIFNNPTAIDTPQLHPQEEIKSIEVYDIHGRLISSKTVNNPTTAILMPETSHYKPGVYIIKYTGTKSSFAKKLLVR